MHLHQPVHPFLRPHLISSYLESCARLRVIHTGCQYWPSIFNPQEGERSWGSFSKHWLHTNLPSMLLTSQHMLVKCIWCGWDAFYGSISILKQFLSYLIHSCTGTIPMAALAGSSASESWSTTFLMASASSCLKTRVMPFPWPVLDLLDLCLLIPSGTRAATTLLQRTRFWLVLFSLAHGVRAAFISASVLLRQVCFGRPTLRFPCGFQSRACLVMLDAGFRSMWPIQPHLRFLISISIGVCFVLSHSCSFETTSGHLILRMFLRHLLVNVCSLWVLVLVTRHVSEP